MARMHFVFYKIFLKKKNTCRIPAPPPPGGPGLCQRLGNSPFPPPPLQPLHRSFIYKIYKTYKYIDLSDERGPGWWMYFVCLAPEGSNVVPEDAEQKCTTGHRTKLTCCLSIHPPHTCRFYIYIKSSPQGTNPKGTSPLRLVPKCLTRRGRAPCGLRGGGE